MKFLKLFIIFCIALTLTGCGTKQDEQQHNKRLVLTEAQEKNAKIQTAPLSMMDIELQITIPAQFKARNQSIERIYSPIDGRLGCLEYATIMHHVSRNIPAHILLHI